MHEAYVNQDDVKSDQTIKPTSLHGINMTTVAVVSHIYSPARTDNQHIDIRNASAS